MVKKTKDDVELDDFGRFSEPALLILVSLAELPRHGYSMTEDIEAIAGVRLGPGNAVWCSGPAGGARAH